MKTIKFQGKDYDLPAYVAFIENRKKIRCTAPTGSPRPPVEQIKKNIEKQAYFGFVVFEDEHVEVRWPENPSKWSYYISLDAAMVAAALRGYEYG